MKKRTSIYAALFLAANITAHANLLPPGGSVIPGIYSGAAPGTLLDTQTAIFTSTLGSGDFSGMVTEWVYRDSITGDMDFVYQFSSFSSSGQPIEQMSDADYGAFKTDVFETSTGVGALSVDRNTNGQNIAWQYLLQPGSTSAELLIKTNALTYGAGTIAFINSGTVTLTEFFAPTTVPEPTFYGLAGLGLIGMIWVQRRKAAR